MTLVLVLKQYDDPADGWKPVNDEPVEASNDKQAIRLATDKLPAEEKTGTFVVVPARSFRPVTREIKTTEVDQWA